MSLRKASRRLVELGIKLWVTGIWIECLTYRIGAMFKKSKTLSTPAIAQLARKLLRARMLFQAYEDAFSRTWIWLTRTQYAK